MTSWLRTLAARFVALFQGKDLEKKLQEELDFHLEMQAEENLKNGMKPEEARQAALRSFGGLDQTKEKYRDDRSLRYIEDFIRDIRHGLRIFRRNPGLSLTVVLTMAIGVGAATSMFGLMRGLLLAPPPHVTSPDKVFRLHYSDLGAERAESHTYINTSYPFYELLADQATSLDAVACYTRRTELAAGIGTGASMTRAVMVSAGFWKVLGTRPLMGRYIADEEAHPVTGSRVVVLGHGFWQRGFGGSADALGRILTIKGQSYEIVGIAPRGFRGVEFEDVDLWLPMFAYEDGSGRPAMWHTIGSQYHLGVVARLKPDVAPKQASEELTILRRSFQRDVYGSLNPAGLDLNNRERALLGTISGGLGDDLQLIPEARVTLWLVGVAFVLLAIACSNVAGLLLLRAMQRRREIAVRLALGVSRGRLTRHFLTETSILALMGGFIAVLMVVFGGPWLHRLMLPAMAWEPATMIDASVLAVAGVCIFGSAFAAGMAPLFYARSGILSALHEGSLRGPARRSRVQGVLLAVQGALSIVLLVGAGLFVCSLHNAQTEDIGLERDYTLAVQIDFTGTGRNSVNVAAFFEQALERVSRMPGVDGASLASNIPLRMSTAGWFRLPGRDITELINKNGGMYVSAVTPGFFATTGMRILQGREFLEQERSRGDAIIVSETVAGLFWPDRSPIGECVQLQQHAGCTTVVGVVADSRMSSLIEKRSFTYWYRPLAVGEELRRANSHALLVRMSPGSGRMDNTIRQALYGLDSELPFIEIETLGEALDPQIRPWRLGAAVFTAFGILSLILAMVGLWSSIAYTVSQRAHEFSVRMAVGATKRALMGLVLREGMRIALTAIAAGLMLAYLGSRFIGDMLYGISPRDPYVYLLITGGVLIVSILASLMPALRAARIDPARALRTD